MVSPRSVMVFPWTGILRRIRYRSWGAHDHHQGDAADAEDERFFRARGVGSYRPVLRLGAGGSGCLWLLVPWIGSTFVVAVMAYEARCSIRSTGSGKDILR